jgi:methionyl-tRNA formyltransferase
MNIVFAGTPAFGLPCLNKLYTSEHQLKAIYTQPDRPAGRGRKLLASPIKEWAQAHQLPVFQPLNFKQTDTINELAALKPDILVVIAYGLILPRAVLEVPRLGCINVHASLLPRWRGASPIQQAILQGDKETGVTIMQMDVGLDTGDMLAHVACSTDNYTAGELHDKLAELAVTPLLDTLNMLACGEARPEKQKNDLATYAPKIDKKDAIINWHQPARNIDQQIRAFNPWPIAQTQVGDTALRIHQAKINAYKHSQAPGTILAMDKNGILVAAKDEAILIERLQFPGAKAMTVAEWLNASRDQLYVNLVLG